MARTPFLGGREDEANRLLRRALTQAAAVKLQLRQALGAVHPRAPVVGGIPPIPGTNTKDRSSQAKQRLAQQREAADTIKDLLSQSTFDANTGITEIVGQATVRRSHDELAIILDPRSWGGNGGPVAASFVVDNNNGNYEPKKLNKKLGEAWDGEELLYEYARTDAASFENILKIEEFIVKPKLIRATYSLFECLVFMVGIFSTPGGLITNEGYVQAEKQKDGSFKLEVVKRVQVKDLTPNDPGNRFDFGETVNAMVGSALTQWIHDTSLLSPIT